MQITCEESVRIDLLGGTLDFYPINHLFQNVRTLNFASTLKTRVRIEAQSEASVDIVSLNYQNQFSFPLEKLKRENFYREGVFSSEEFQEMSFVCLIIQHFGLREGIKITLDSDSPHGAGLGGSSSLGITLFKALCEFTGVKFDPEEGLPIVQQYEAMILGQGVPGYQDYYPALYGGILSLQSCIPKVEVEQVYSESLKKFLESYLVLIDSGVSRSSGINNWEVYKGFFDDDQEVRSALYEISQCAEEGYQAIKKQSFDTLLSCMKREGKVRENLAPNFLIKEV